MKWWQSRPRYVSVELTYDNPVLQGFGRLAVIDVARCRLLSNYEIVSEGRSLRTDFADPAVGLIDSSQHCRGYGRESTAMFIQFLRVAQSSLKKLETHVMLAERVELLDVSAATSLSDQCERVSKMLRNLIRALQSKGVG